MVKTTHVLIDMQLYPAVKAVVPYLYDGDKQAVSTAFGPAANLHLFIFNIDRKLRFSSRIEKDSCR